MSGCTGPKAKQPIKYGEIGSSRLRYEIQPDLMVDEHFAGKSNIEVPGSDIIIPETQPDNGEEEMQSRLLEEEPLSPNSRSLIEKNVATKESSSLAPPEPYKFLSKQATTDSGLLTPSFSFAPMASKNTHASFKNSKLSPRPSIASSTLLSDRAALEVDRARSEEGLTGPATYIRDFPDHQADTTRGRYEPKYNAPKPQNEQDISFGPKGTEEGTASHTNGSRENTASSGPVELPAATAQRTSTKTKKSRKIPKAPISMDPWPPRARGISVQPIPAIPTNESYTVKCSGNITAQLIGDPKTTSNHFEVEKQRSNPPHAVNDDPRIPENATHGPLENPSVMGAEKNRVDTELFEAHRPPAHIDSTTQFEESKENEASVPLPMAADREGNGSPSGSGGRQSPMSIAHETSWVGVSGRVSKPQLRQCNSVQPGLKRIQVKRSPIPSLSFDQYLDGIRMMHNAEQTRVRQNHDTRIKDLEDIIGLLREKNIMQKEHINTSLERENALKSTVEQFKKKSSSLERYVSGVGNDYDKLKAETRTRNQENQEVLNAKIVDNDRQKRSVIDEYQSAMDSIRKNRRATMEALEDCFEKLRVSEVTRRTLSEDLRRTKKTLEDEKQRSSILQDNMMSSLREILGSVRGNNDMLINKLEAIQKSVNSTSLKEGSEAAIRECIEALKNFQATPLPTAKDIHAFKDVLRQEHKSIDLKLAGLSKVLGDGTAFRSSIQGSIHERFDNISSVLSNLRDKWEEFQKMHQKTDNLVKELDGERKCSTELRARATELADSSSHLQRELNDLKSKAADRQAEISDLEGKIIQLENELKDAHAELKEAAKQQTTHKKIAISWQDRENDYKEKLAEAVQMAKVDSDRKLKEQADRDKSYEENLKETRINLTEEINRLKDEKRDLEGRVQNLDNELGSTRHSLQLASEKRGLIDKELKSLRKRQADGDYELKQHQKNASSRLDTLAIELQKTKDDLQTTTGSFNASQVEIKTLKNQFMELEATKKSLIEKLKQEFELQLSRVSQEYANTLKEREDALAKAEQRSEDIDTQTRNLLMEKDTQLEDLNRRSTEAQTAYRKMEASYRKLEAESDRKLKAHKKETAKAMLQVVDEISTHPSKSPEALEEFISSAGLQNSKQIHEDRRPGIVTPVQTPLQNKNSGNLERLFDQNLGPRVPARSQLSEPGQETNMSRDREYLLEGSDNFDSIEPDNDLGPSEFLDEYSIPIMDYAPHLVPDTQETDPPGTFQVLEDITHQKRAKSRKTTSELSSSMSSEALNTWDQRVSQSRNSSSKDSQVLCLNRSPNRETGHEAFREEVLGSLNESKNGIRPKTQANTATRPKQPVIPPNPAPEKNRRGGKGKQLVIKLKIPVAYMEENDRGEFSESRNQTNGGEWTDGYEETGVKTFRQKRKASSAQLEHKLSSKKLRSASKNSSDNIEIVKQSPVSTKNQTSDKDYNSASSLGHSTRSHLSSRSQDQVQKLPYKKNLSSTRGSTSRSGRSRGGDHYQDRFDQEFGS